MASEDMTESTKRLEQQIKRVSTLPVDELREDNEATTGTYNMASPDVNYVGSMVGVEDGLPSGTLESRASASTDGSPQMRQRVIEKPFGSKIGYYELEDEKEDADEEWMTGEASQVSGGGSRGSRNWCLKIMFPILIIVAIMVCHNWWEDIKKHAAAATDAVGDVFDRRALEEMNEGEAGERESVAALGGDMAGVGGVDERKASVYSVTLEEAPAHADAAISKAKKEPARPAP